MLCPEVSDFKAPYSLFEIETVDYGKLFNKNINRFYYNHLLSVILPDSLTFPEDLAEKLILDCEYYQVFNLNLSVLIDSNFLTSFIKSGKLTLLSVGTRIDCDNCIGIVPTGQLILNVDKETYQSLGLEGKVSHFAAKNKSRYIFWDKNFGVCVSTGDIMTALLEVDVDCVASDVPARQIKHKVYNILNMQNKFVNFCTRLAVMQNILSIIYIINWWIWVEILSDAKGLFRNIHSMASKTKI